MEKKDHPFKNSQAMPLSLRAFFAVMTFVFKVLDKVSRPLAGRLALRLFMIPPKHRMPAREVATSESADVRFYTIHDKEIAVRSWGEGPVILLSHGWGGRSTQLFSFVQPLVDAGYRVVGCNLPAHGESSGKNTNMLEASLILSEVVKKEVKMGEGLKAIIGHSFGSGTALLTVHRYQIKPEKLVLISCFADIHWVTRTFGDVFEMSDQVVSAMEQTAYKQLDNAYGKAWHWDDLSPTLNIQKVSQETLLIHDKEDHEVPYEHATQLHDAALNSELLSTTGYGHRKILMNQKVVDATVGFVSQ
ncbi:MAG: Unknown protein [uncultured Thiotrichaceae bacterium]|uniref:AB hydrolase-1 domain-containing protein n=1 Tax=uncultured Thiotrichaceae bacterium TaxID=298394 RepID=A0A6S6SUU9_9GAMM|nr:MAG: Unknown protein [uncultured Thiotrichaceae bacterium]